MAHWSSCAVHNAPALPVGPCDCGDDAPMTATVIQIRDYQNKRDIDRLYEEITAELAAIEIGSIEIIEDTAPYVAPETDPA